MGSFRFAKYDNAGVGIDDPNAQATFAKVGSAVPGDGNVAADGMTCEVSAFRLGNWSFAGGSITIPSNGVWFVGVEFWSNQLRVLPRLGHRGWIPVARVLAMGGAIASVERIEPVMPECRIPRTMAKILAGQPIHIVYQGSSLVEGTSGSTWTGHLTIGTADHYRLPGTPTSNNIARGGAPNMLGLAHAGRPLGMQLGGGFDEAGYPLEMAGIKAAPTGRSAALAAADVVFVECLANGGDYRLSMIEPHVRNLRKMGLEVVLVTSNPQIANSAVADYNTLTTSALYIDGPTVQAVAEKYGCELADTAAYVVEAQIRAGGVGIFADTIHMLSGSNTAGPAALLPSSGHEAYARAARSVFHISVQSVPPSISTASFDFSTGLQGTAVYGSGATADASTGALVVTKTAAGGAAWGWRFPALVGPVPGTVAVGDTVRITGAISHSGGATDVSMGMQGGGSGWNGASYSAVPGNFDITVTISRAATDAYFLFYASQGAMLSGGPGTTFTVDNVQMTVTRFGAVTTTDAVPGRASDHRPLPPSRIVTDPKEPGDAWVVLPKDEFYTRTNHASKGALAAHLDGSGSFARRFSPNVYGAGTEDSLVLTAGKSALVGALGAVGFGIIWRGVIAETATVEVYLNNVLLRTMTFTASIERELYSWIRTPTDHAISSIAPADRELRLTCTGGTLRIGALVVFTSEYDTVPLSEIEFMGAGWATGVVPGGNPNMPGRETDTLGDAARIKCPANACRVYWLTSSKPNSKPVNTWGGSELASGTATVGVNHIRVRGGHIGPGSDHYIQCAETLAGGGDSTNGYALHVGGAIVVYDR